MGSMEALGTSGIPLVAAFFIGLVMTFSPCPLATNITAIAFISKKIGDSRHTLLVGTLYALGRMVAYIGLTALIVYAGLNIQSISLFLQEYGEKLIGPFLVIMGILMLEIVDIPSIGGQGWLQKIELYLGEKGYLGGFLLGIIFALALCPFAAVLFFGMLIPIALKTGDAIFVPAVFGIATPGFWDDDCGTEEREVDQVGSRCRVHHCGSVLYCHRIRPDGWDRNMKDD